MENKKTNTRMLVAIVVLIMIIIFGGILFTLSSMGYLNFNEEKVPQSNNEQPNSVIKLTEAEALSKGKELYDKATEIYETWALVPYCGFTYQEVTEQKEENFGYDVRYYDSGMKNLEELKQHLSQWLSEEIIKEKITETAITDVSLLKEQKYSFTNYIEKDGKLYCRAHTGKGWLTYYLNEYDLSVEKIDNNTIVYSVKSAYANYKAQENYSKCLSGNIKDCKEDEIEYKDTTFVIEKNESNNWVVLKYQLHD